MGKHMTYMKHVFNRMTVSIYKWTHVSGDTYTYNRKTYQMETS